jgi:dipeptidyl aminopeptidase/acylaminoacyl peptidase
MGFSLQGYATYYITTHTKKTIPAAAIVADSALRTYDDVGLPALTGGWGAGSGADYWYGGTFWDPEARKRWLEHAPTFNIDKVETPVLFAYSAAMGPSLTANGLQEVWGAFAINRKEKDVLITPNMEHNLHRPRQRQASLQSTVDWMCFWLQGKEIDSDKTEVRQEQYYYWRQLRKQRDDRWAKNGNPYDQLAKQQNIASTAEKGEAKKPADQ